MDHEPRAGPRPMQMYSITLSTTIQALDAENAAWIAQTIATNRGLLLEDVKQHEQESRLSEQLGDV